MRYITEQELRDSFAGGVPASFTLPADCRLTPLAEQYLRELKLYGGEGTLKGAKPEHMTHLNSREMVAKTHPRIVLRGKLDSLESEILVAMVPCDPAWRALLGDALKLVRQILAADVKDAPLPPWTLGGMGAEEVHRGSHHPENFGLSGHLLPAPEQDMLAAQMNRLRAITRETELAAIAAWQDGVRLCHEDCVLALNRLSSYFYLLQLRAATGAQGR